MDVKLLNVGDILVLVFPSDKYVVPLRIVEVRNYRYRILDYGIAPIPQRFPLYNYFNTKTILVPMPGLMPPFTMATPNNPIQFPPLPVSDLPTQVWSTQNMWYIDTSVLDKDTLTSLVYHIYLLLDPPWIKASITAPPKRNQYMFAKEYVAPTGGDIVFGWKTTPIEYVSVPGIDFGYLFMNDTNMPVIVKARFIYAEYKVRPILDTDLLVKVFLGEEKAYFYMYPDITGLGIKLDETLRKAFGVTPLPLDVVNPPSREELLSLIKKNYKVVT